jgi:hypothetical protein
VRVANADARIAAEGLGVLAYVLHSAVRMKRTDAEIRNAVMNELAWDTRQ